MDMLIEMGFSATAISEALDATEGDVAAAIELLLARKAADDESSVQTTCLELSQYSFSDVDTSACTSIACTAVVSILGTINSHAPSTSSDSASAVAQLNSDIVHKPEYLTSILQEGINRHRILSRTNSHSGADDFFAVHKDLGSRVRRIGSFQSSLTQGRCFHKMIDDVYKMPSIDQHKYVGLVITKPPETIAVFLPPTVGAFEPKFILFDSHSRPERGLFGSYVQSSSSKEDIVSSLQTLFPSASVAPGKSLSLMEEMYFSFEVTVFQAALSG